jgi:hypothetical protein
MLSLILEKFTNLFELNWTKFEKVMREIEIRKERRRKIEKNRKRAPGTNFGPTAKQVRGLLKKTKAVSFFSSPPR